MTHKPNSTLICIAYLLTLSLCISARLFAADQKEIDERLAKQLLSSERLELLVPVNKVIDSLNIKPGMKIAEIGAGQGVFTFLLADALKGSGVIYATDIYEPTIKRLEQMVKEKGYLNVVPVLLADPYKDPFYKENSFDIVFISDVLPFIWRLKDYFRELRPCLIPKIGRLFVLEGKWISSIDETDISNVMAPMASLAQKGADFPIFKRLSKESRDFILQWDRKSVPQPMRQRLVRDLSAMLLDNKLFGDLIDYYYAKSGSPKTSNILPPETLLQQLDLTEAKYARLLATDLDDAGIMDKNAEALSVEEKERLQRLNKLLICNLLKIDSFSYRQEVAYPYVVFRSKRSLIAKIEAAGFQLVGDYDLLSKYYFLEFKTRDRPG